MSHVAPFTPITIGTGAFGWTRAQAIEPGLPGHNFQLGLERSGIRYERSRETGYERSPRHVISECPLLVGPWAAASQEAETAVCYSYLWTGGALPVPRKDYMM